MRFGKNMGMAGGTLRAIRTAGDKAGRVTLPKPLRDRLGLPYDILQAFNEDREDREHEIFGLCAGISTLQVWWLQWIAKPSPTGPHRVFLKLARVGRGLPGC